MENVFGKRNRAANLNNQIPPLAILKQHFLRPEINEPVKEIARILKFAGTKTSDRDRTDINAQYKKIRTGIQKYVPGLKVDDDDISRLVEAHRLVAGE